jgi:hypothetical protein
MSMAVSKAYLRKLWLYVLLMVLVLFGVTAGALYLAAGWIQNKMHLMAATDTAPLKMAATLDGWRDHYFVFGTAGLAVCFCMAGIILWLLLRGAAKKAFSRGGKQAPVSKAPSPAAATESQADRRGRERLYLHLFCLLQREGRLMDFFTEDLDQYEDAQIGAAVRGLHGDWRKTIDKQLSPAPVIDQPEGSEAIVRAGFDPQAVKLIGNVAGEPPFKGILRHRGWRARRLELPTLTDVEDTGIIAPAEVELS